MNGSIKQIKRQMVVLDVLPFAYNLLIIVNLFLNFFGIYLPILSYLFGFSMLVCFDLLLRSFDNNYCVWHRAPIYNILMINVFHIAHYVCSLYGYDLIKDVQYPILYGIFMFWVLLFAVSSIFFLRKRIKKLHRRCTSFHC